jgi:predicted metal-dependent HD superfamily phosphohydrolase
MESCVSELYGTVLVQELEEARHLMDNPDATEWGLWHHDEVMKEQSRVNEERSALSAYNTAKHALLSDEFAEHAKRAALATKHDKIPETKDEKYAADIDLSIFGKPPEEFDEYEGNIRKEYSWVDEKTFWARRVEILERFLKREQIYSTEFFRDKYEDQARENLGEDTDS